MADDDHIDDALASELTLLADGRLPDDRRAALEERIARSPALVERVREQRAITERLAATAEAVGAPARLRARVDADRKPARRRAFAWTAALVAPVAAAALILALILLGSPAGPSLAQAASVGELRPTSRRRRRPAPRCCTASRTACPSRAGATSSAGSPPAPATARCTGARRRPSTTATPKPASGPPTRSWAARR